VLADPTRQHFGFGAAFAGLILLLAGCADTRGGPIPYDRALAAPDEPTVASLGEGYKIAPMDQLTIKVFNSKDLSDDYDVDLAGHISLPLIGEVEAANLTTAQLDDALTARLGEKYFEHPDVSVAVKKSVGRLVTVDGAVKDAGSFPILGNLSLMQAVALAKGTSDDANVHRVAVFRTIGGKRQAAAFDLVSIRRGQAQDPSIYPGDIVVVDGSSIKAFQKQFFQSVPLLSIFRPF
jgi:polysaccharide export outer membrane protein